MKPFLIILGVLCSLGAIAVPLATRYVNENGPDWMKHVPGEIDPNGEDLSPGIQWEL